MARASPPAALAITEFLFNLQFRRSEYYLETVIEPVPQSASRITLIPEKDRLGMNKFQLDSNRLSEADKPNFLTSVRAVLAEMKGQGFGDPCGAGGGSYSILALSSPMVLASYGNDTNARRSRQRRC